MTTDSLQGSSGAPGDQAPSGPGDNTATAGEVYAALNRNDIPAVMALFDPAVELFDPESEPEETGGFPSAGIYRGHAEVAEHITRARAAWAEGSCAPERFLAAGNNVIVFVHVRVRLKDRTEWNEGHLGDVLTFRDGKVIEFRSFLRREQALAWAGVPGGA